MSSQDISEEDISAVVSVLRSDTLTRGNIRDKFEFALAEYIDYTYAISVCNGSVALDIALASLCLPYNARVGVCPLTFIASINCIFHNNHIPVFIDCDSTGCINPDLIPDDIDALICIDFGGQSCDYDRIRFKIGDKPIIQDGAHSFGIKKHPEVDIMTTSFHPLKIITTGEGGCIFTDNRLWAVRCIVFRNNGLNIMSGVTRIHGWNAHLNEISCALGLSQLRRLKQFLYIRKEKAEYWHKVLNIKYLDTVKWLDNSYHFIPVLFPNTELRDKALKISPLLRHNYQLYKDAIIDCPKCADISSRVLSLPTHNKLDNETINYIAKNIHELLRDTDKKK